jgi:hypothetical protein
MPIFNSEEIEQQEEKRGTVWDTLIIAVAILSMWLVAFVKKGNPIFAFGYTLIPALLAILAFFLTRPLKRPISNIVFAVAYLVIMVWYFTGRI